MLFDLSKLEVYLTRVKRFSLSIWQLCVCVFLTSDQTPFKFSLQSNTPTIMQFDYNDSKLMMNKFSLRIVCFTNKTNIIARKFRENYIERYEFGI